MQDVADEASDGAISRWITSDNADVHADGAAVDITVIIKNRCFADGAASVDITVDNGSV